MKSEKIPYAEKKENDLFSYVRQLKYRLESAVAEQKAKLFPMNAASTL